jgi:hypothetical protein
MFLFCPAANQGTGSGGNWSAMIRQARTSRGRGDTQVGDREHESVSIRWVCDCSRPPILLAIYDDSGRIEIKVRDRYYIARGHLQATCPRCGTRHLLDIHQHAPPA